MFLNHNPAGVFLQKLSSCEGEVIALLLLFFFPDADIRQVSAHPDVIIAISEFVCFFRHQQLFISHPSVKNIAHQVIHHTQSQLLNSRVSRSAYRNTLVPRRNTNKDGGDERLVGS